MQIKSSVIAATPLTGRRSPAAPSKTEDSTSTFGDQSSVDWHKVGRGALYGGVTTAVLGGISTGLAHLGVSQARAMGVPEYLVGVAGGCVVGAMCVWMGREQDVLPNGK